MRPASASSSLPVVPLTRTAAACSAERWPHGGSHYRDGNEVGPMISNLRKMGNVSPALFAVLIAGALPAAARAEGLSFRNDTNGPIIVQAGVSARGVMKPGRPYLLNPGDSTPAIVMPGDKVIFVFDGKNP